MMLEDIAIIDFALVAAPPIRVGQALAQVVAMRHGAGDGEPGSFGRNRGNLISRIVSRQLDASPPDLALQRDDGLPSSPLARAASDDLGYTIDEALFRLTAPLGPSGLTLLEFRERDGETSPLCEGLSAELPETEVFRFRLSGERHPGSDTAFEVYLDGRAVRRTASISASGTAPEADWRVVDSGIPHPAEAESLPGARARAWEIMTPERQGAILRALGVDADQLFDDLPDRTSVVLSTAPGGAPLGALADLFSEPGDASDEVRAPESESRETADDPAEEPDDEAWEAEITAVLVSAVTHALPEDQQVAWLTTLTTRLEAGEVDAALRDARALIASGNRPEQEKAADIARLDMLFGLPSASR